MLLIWTFRALVLVLGPLVGYLHTAETVEGAFAGLVVALAVVGLEVALSKVALVRVVLGLLGAMAGFVAGNAIGGMFQGFAGTNSLLVLKVMFAYLGAVVVIRKLPELASEQSGLLSRIATGQAENLYVLDCSTLMDGRIQDILKTRIFSNATLVVSKFIVDELQKLSEDPDNQKRARAQRALKVLAAIQEDGYAPLRVAENDYTGNIDVAEKTLRLAKDIKAKMITTVIDTFRLSAADAAMIINLNDIAVALKPAVLPGEPIHVYLLKDGKEKEQGVGYLDDGTMVVVEGARNLIGKRVEVTVASVLQTSAGKMVFSKLRNHHRETV